MPVDKGLITVFTACYSTFIIVRKVVYIDYSWSFFMGMSENDDEFCTSADPTALGV